jgi:hypothetical protein
MSMTNTARSMITNPNTAMNMAILIITVKNTTTNTGINTHTITTMLTGTVTNMGMIMSTRTLTNIATGTKLISTIRNTRQSLIAERRASALISPRNWLKCSFCKEMN